MLTIAACGRGRAMRARPRRSSSKPSPSCTATTAMPSTRAKLVKLRPAANQKWPGWGGKDWPSCRSSCIGSGDDVAATSRALISG